MQDPALTLVVIGAFLLLGLLTDFLGRRTPLPRVTLLLVAGMVLGRAGFDVLPAHCEVWFPVVAGMALVMVGFLLGGTLTRGSLRRHGRRVLGLSAVLVVVTAVSVGMGLALLRVPLELALLLAGIAIATAPAVTLDVIDEVRARGPFTTLLRGIVAVDDAWGLIVFSVLLALGSAWTGTGGWDALGVGAWEIGGALVVGVALGVPMAYLTGRIRPGEPTLIEALGLVLLCGGIALWLEVSYLLAAMVLGAVVTNLARHHKRPFHAIKEVEWPFLVVFFLLAGASLNLDTLAGAGALGGAYVLLRVLGRLVGGHVGGALLRTGPEVGRWMGPALLPQAGLALGMALVAADRFPQHAAVLMQVVIGSNVVFELVGPVATRFALARVGESRRSPREPARGREEVR